MRRGVIKGLTLIAVVCALCVAGYFAGQWAELPAVATWTEEEVKGKSKALHEAPSDREMERQIRALTERDPVETASMNYLQGDGPWYYGVRTKDGWVVPGFAPDSVVLTERMFPVRIISWTGEAGKGARYEALDRAAVEYATKYNQRMDVILCTN